MHFNRINAEFCSQTYMLVCVGLGMRLISVGLGMRLISVGLGMRLISVGLGMRLISVVISETFIQHRYTLYTRWV